MYLIHTQEMWVLTVQEWLVILVFVAALVVFLLTHIYSFLALSSPIKADILVLEGWMPEYAIREAIREFETGGYKKIITIGASLSQGYYICQYKNFAELGAANLMALGLAPDKLVAVPISDVLRNSIYAAAVTLRQWIADSELKIESINLYTFDVHSRRSHLIFKRTFAPEIKVGVIVLEPLGYDPKYWWISSAGVKTIIAETITYIYARFVDWSS